MSSDNKEHKNQSNVPSSVPIGVHESKDWNKKKAAHLLRCSTIYYRNGIKDSALAGTLEGISNAPSWYFATEMPTPGVISAAFLGGGLVVSILSETAIKLIRENSVLGILERYQENITNEGKDAALVELEKDMHKQGLLFENIPEYDLKVEYPAEAINRSIKRRAFFTNKDKREERILDISNKIYFEPGKSTLKLTGRSLKAAQTLCLGTLGLAKNIGKGFFKFLDYKGYIGIAKGSWAIPKTFYHFSIKTGESRFAVKQKPFLTQVKQDASDSNLGSAKVTAELAEEVDSAAASLKRVTREAQFEAGKLSVEKGFITAHALDLHENMDVDSLKEGFDAARMSGFTDFETLLTMENIKSIASMASILAAWTPYVHMAERTDELYKVITGKRSTETQQYAQISELHKDMLVDEEEYQRYQEALRGEEPEDHSIG